MAKELIDYLEECLRIEGLTDLIPHDRREPILAFLTTVFAYTWLLSLWILQFLTIAYLSDFERVLWPALFAPILLLILAVGLVICGVVMQLVYKRNLLGGSQAAGRFGMIVLLGLPFLLSVATGLYLSSFFAFIFQVGIYIGAIILYLVLFYQRFRILRALNFARSSFRVLLQSIQIATFLFPVLLVLVLLSAFSDDLWKAVGKISILSLSGVIGLIIFPGVLVVIATFRTTVTKVNQFPRNAKSALEDAASFPYLNDLILRGFVSSEEWDGLDEDLQWREVSKAEEAISPLVQRKIRNWFLLLLLISASLVATASFIYFLLLFYLILSPEIIYEWTGIEPSLRTFSFEISSRTYDISVSSAAFVRAKVAIIISIFITLFSIVHSATDDNASGRLISWLQVRARWWTALGIAYDSLLHPGYQIWSYKNRNPKLGYATVNIVVPRDSDGDAVEASCHHLQTRLHDIKRAVFINAFERNESTQSYEEWSKGRRWMYSINKSDNKSSIDTWDDSSDDETSSQYFLGRDSRETNNPIPDTWFSNREESVPIARQLWEDARWDGLILHPYISLNNQNVYLTIRLTKRLPSSLTYREVLAAAVRLTFTTLPELNDITARLMYRDTYEELASLWWWQASGDVSYRDEFTNKTSYEEVSEWGLPDSI